jgi:hypothetical protein
MKSALRHSIATLGVAALLPVLAAADEASKSAEKSADQSGTTEKKELRVLAAPDHGVRSTGRVYAVRTGEPAEKETVAFLGVMTSPVSATLSAQLGLAAGSGLVVNHLDENGPASGALKEHDILLKLEDQLLVDAHQLSVLIRQRKEGDEVTLTYIRGGKQATARVKLGKHEVPKVSLDVFTQPLGGGNGFALAQGNGAGAGNRTFEIVTPEPGTPGMLPREDVDHILGLIQSRNGEPVQMRIEHMDGPGFRAMSVNTNNSSLSYSDDNGALELTVKEGKKSLVAKNPKGEQVFAGPVNTP